MVLLLLEVANDGNLLDLNILITRWLSASVTDSRASVLSGWDLHLSIQVLNLGLLLVHDVGSRCRRAVNCGRSKVVSKYKVASIVRDSLRIT